MNAKSIIPAEGMENLILVIRGQKVMIDRDLAKLYGVSTKRLNEQVKRNTDRFPKDFMFKLMSIEKSELVANCDRFNSLKHSKYLPFAFTEHGAVMLASILNSKRAVEASIYVVRAFIRLREILLTHTELAQKFRELELRIDAHDEQIAAILEAINQLLMPPEPSKRKIGFEVKEKKTAYFH